VAGRRRLLLLAPIEGTDPIESAYRRAPIDESFAERLLGAASSVPTRRRKAGNGYVYVALLKPRRTGGPHRLYVGSTGLGPMARYRNHMLGIKSGRRWIKRGGLGLLPKVYARFNPMLGRDKEKVEDELGRAFKAAGFEVHGPHRKPAG
jgi:hypothetical protein